MTCINNLLSPQEVFQLRQAANAMPFVPGTETAGQRASRIKHNEQISQATNDRKALQHLLLTALIRNKEFNRAALPKHIRPPMICRYQLGMSYGRHVDSGLMGPKLGQQQRYFSHCIPERHHRLRRWQLAHSECVRPSRHQAPQRQRCHLSIHKPARGNGSDAGRTSSGCHVSGPSHMSGKSNSAKSC